MSDGSKEEEEEEDPRDDYRSPQGRGRSRSPPSTVQAKDQGPLQRKKIKRPRKPRTPTARAAVARAADDASKDVQAAATAAKKRAVRARRYCLNARLALKNAMLLLFGGAMLIALLFVQGTYVCIYVCVSVSV
jgi:hypothetical protein